MIGEAEESSPAWGLVWMLGLSGGVFSELGFRRLKMDLLFLVEVDLGRRFRSEEAEMVPKNRDSPALSVFLFFVLIVLRSRAI